MVPVGRGPWQRWAEPSETHHVEIFEVVENGKTVRRGDVVSMREAMERIRRGEPVVRRHAGPNTRFLFSLCKEDTVRLAGEKAGIWVVKKIAQKGQLTLVQQYDARPETERAPFSPRIGGLRQYSTEKVRILPIGDVVRCHD